MSNTAKWVAGISGSAVAGISIIYLGVGMLLRSYPADSAELEDADDAVAGASGRGGAIRNRIAVVDPA